MPAPSVPLDAIRQPAWVYGPDGRVVAANDLAEALAGRPLAGCSIAEVGRIFQYRHDDGTPFAPAELPAARAFAGEEVVDLAVTVALADGREREVVATASPIRDGETVTGALVVWQDVTERKRTEETEARLRALMDHNPCLVFLKDEQGRYVYLNRTYERQFVHSPDWQGKTDFDLWPEKSAALFRANDREVLASGTTHQFMEDSTDLDGTRYVWFNYKFPFVDAQGRRYVGGVGIDATARVRTEEALAESEAEYRHIVEYAPTGIYELDYTGPAFRRVNDAMCKVLGYSREELLGMDPSELMDEESRQRFQERVGMILAGKAVDESVAFRIFTKDGREIWAELNVKPTFTDGRMTGALVVAHDITERRRMEKLLRDSEQQLRLATQAAGMCAWELDIATGEVTFSGNVREVVGFSYIEDDDVFSRIGRYVVPEDASRHQEALRRTMQGEGDLHAVNRVVNPETGEIVWLETHATLVRADDGTPLRVVGVARNITGRKRAEATLRESEEWFRSIYEESPIGIELYNADGRLLDVNRAAKAIFGVEDAGVLKGFDLFADPNVTDEVKHRITQGGTVHYRGVFDFDTVRRMDLYPTAKVGTIQIDVTIVPLHRDTGGQISGYLVQVQDITERVQAEEDVQQYTESLRRSNEDLQRFAYVASHDLQEPLRSVISFSQLLERRYKGQLGQDADEYIDFIVEGGNRMQGLILDLLAFSRVNTTRQQIARTDAEEVLAEAERTLDVSLREAGAILTHDPLPVVMADPTQLAQVFANLVSNAVKFRKPDVPLRIHLGARRLDGFWEFSVRDNGIGIEPEYFEKIFVIFQRLHTKETYPGTGIGLAIVKRIVDRHGGRIWLESTPGEGATFFFTLPDGSFKNGGGNPSPGRPTTGQ